MASYTYPPAAPGALPPPTTNSLSREDRAHFVRSSKKLGRVLGDTPHFVDGEANDDSNLYPPADMIARPTTSSGTSLRTMDSRTSTGQQNSPQDDIWAKRKPKHLPPLLKLAFTSTDSSQPMTAVAVAADSPLPISGSSNNNNYAPLRSAPARKTSHSHSSRYSPTASSFHSPNSERRSKLERLRRKLGEEVPMEAVFPSTPTTATPKPRKTHARSRTMTANGPLAMHSDSSESIVFSISSSNSGDCREQQHTVVLKTSTRTNKYQNAPPVPPLPPNSYPHISSRAGPSRANLEEDEAGLMKPRLKPAVGSKIGSKDYVAHRRAKREGRGGMETIEMVGFMGGGMGGF
ncbi:hypothetical protein BV22DRAFT_145676 [Leucogyrophana mollusca]|uniref:Uncharacterized protein n=1 Tax=Leucogyrophana mollusca TaxID=85980 RepID=A0ACB8BVR1_9AGAM|nr:hypothetical protein BV22DRAFT_145676 [Leucogyrophana mollusca]